MFDNCIPNVSQSIYNFLEMMAEKNPPGTSMSQNPIVFKTVGFLYFMDYQEFIKLLVDIKNT